MTHKRSDNYETKTVHYFNAGGERWQVNYSDDECIQCEETRKNGQEDCHVSFEALLEDGRWQIDEGRDRIVDSFWADTADEIEEFLNRVGAP